MEKLSHNKEQNSLLDDLFSKKNELRKQLRTLRKDLEYDAEQMMFLYAHRDSSQDEKDFWLNRIEADFNKEPEVLELSSEIDIINDQILLLEQTQKNEREANFPNKKKEHIDTILALKENYQLQYNNYQSIRNKLEKIVSEKIQPGIDLGMNTETAIREYLNGTEYYSYPGYIDDIERINEKIGELILNLEIRSEEINDLSVEDMNKLKDLSSVNFLQREIKSESFKREIDLLNKSLNYLNK